MRRSLRALSAALVALVGTAALAKGPARLGYSVDAASTTPGATVVTREGVTVVIFKTAAFTAGDTYSFTMTMTPTKVGRVSFPVNAVMGEEGSSKLEPAFTPDSLTFGDATTPVTVSVALTLEPVDYSKAKRLVATIKADPDPGTHLGRGPGVKVVIVKSSSAAAAAESPEAAMRQDVLAAHLGEAAPAAAAGP